MKRRFLVSAVLTLIIIALLVTLPGCMPDKDQPSDTTAPSGSADETSSDEGNEESYILDNLPDNLSFQEAEVTFLVWEECPMLEFYADVLSGEIINDAIYERNQIVEERLDVKLKYAATLGNATYMADYMKKAEADLTSGACEYDVYAGYSRAVPAMVLSGHCEELTGLDYLDFEMPWWPDALLEQCMVNDRLYFCSGDLSTTLLWMMIGTFFNKELVEQNGIENPYDLVRSNKWTIDKFMELNTNKYSDLNGDGNIDSGDFYGFIIYNVNIDALFTAVGFSALEKNSNGDLVISPMLNSQRIYDLLDKLGNFFATPDVSFNNDTSIRSIFFEQRALFTTDRVFIVCGKDYGSTASIEFEYGLIPNPKYDIYQENYSTNVGHTFTMYAISKGAFDANACAAVFECLSSESYRRVTPMVFETAMKIKYASDEVTTEMYDILRNTVDFDLGRFYSTQTEDVYKSMRKQVIDNTKTFASQYKGLSNIIENGIVEILKAFSG